VCEVRPSLTYDCGANDRDVQGDKAIPLPKEEIQDSDPDTQPDTSAYGGQPHFRQMMGSTLLRACCAISATVIYGADSSIGSSDTP
jgi:hypothetical protein